MWINRCAIHSEGQTFSPDSSSFESGIYDTLAAYAQENDASVNEENLQNISELCGELYREHATLSYVGSIGHYANLFRTPLLLASVVCAVIAGILILLEISMHRFKHRALRYIICSVAGSDCPDCLSRCRFVIRKDSAPLHHGSGPSTISSFHILTLRWATVS